MTKFISAFILGVIASAAVFFLINQPHSSHQKIATLKKQFQEMVVQKNASLIPQYYDPDFILYANGTKTDYQTLLESHTKLYKTPIQYKVRFDEATLVESADHVGGRIFITTQMPGKKPTEIEVILLLKYKNGKIYRAWELTRPDWTTMPELQDVVPKSQ